MEPKITSQVSIASFIKTHTKLLSSFAEIFIDERARLWRVSGLVDNKPLEKAAEILVYDTACYLY